MIRKEFVILCASVVFLSACTVKGSGFPINEKANKNHIVDLHYVNKLSGHGEVEATMSNGEKFTGTYTTVDSDTWQASSFESGALYNSYNSVYGSQLGTASVSGPVAHGIANLVSDRERYMQCLYHVSNTSGHGSGVCSTNDGAEYQIHF